MTAGSYGSAPGYQPDAAPAPRHGAGMATAALVLGIVALVFCWTVVGGIVLGLLAIIFGFIGLRRAKVGAPGKVRAIFGLITGVIGLLVAVALVVAGVSLLNSSSFKNLQDCLNSAGSNQAQIQSCQNQFQNNVTN